MGCTPSQRKNEVIPQVNSKPSVIPSKKSNPNPSIEEIINNEHISNPNYLLSLDLKMN